MGFDAAHISFSYSAKKILDDLSLDVNKGEFVAILGENGAGKSTLLRCVARLLTPSSGTFTLDGSPLSALSRRECAKRVAFLPQNAECTDISVYDTVLLGRKPYIRSQVSANDGEKVRAVLSELSLSHLALRETDTLSGGERQKVMLARALVCEPQLLLLDEPTSSLDLKNQLEVLSLIKLASKKRKITVISVLHDLNSALRFCDKFALLSGASLLAFGGREVISEENLTALYGIPVAVVEVRGQTVVLPK